MLSCQQTTTVDLGCAVCHQHAPSVFGWRRQDCIRKKCGEARLFLPRHSSASVCGGCLLQPSNRRLAIWIHDFSKVLGTDGWTEYSTCWHCQWSGESQSNRTATRRTMDWQLVGRVTRQRIATNCTGRRWRQSWDQSTRVATTRGSPSTSNVPEFRQLAFCTEPISISLAAQTIVVGVPTQELVVNMRFIIQNSTVPAMEAILVTTTEGHMRLERARERCAQFAEELV